MEQSARVNPSGVSPDAAIEEGHAATRVERTGSDAVRNAGGRSAEGLRGSRTPGGGDTIAARAEPGEDKGKEPNGRTSVDASPGVLSPLGPSAQSPNGGPATSSSQPSSSSQPHPPSDTPAATPIIPHSVNPSEEDEAASKNLRRLFMQLGIRHNSRALKEFYKFWETQPVPQFNDTPGLPPGPINPPKTISDVVSDPIKLPPAYEWVSCDVSSDQVVDEIYKLLLSNYVEDDESQFRFKYSPEFLRWALMTPNYRQDWHVGVRSAASKRLFGFITAVPARMHVDGSEINTAEINFLCVHKRLRGKRLSPILIREVTRRVNLTGVWHAVYTAGIVLPTPVAVARYWHRSLNPKKLIEVGFSALQPRMTMARTIRLYKLPSEPQIKGFRAMDAGDVEQVHGLLSTYLKRYPLHPAMSIDDVQHWLLPRPGVIDSFVVESEGRITDFTSFYTLPSSILNHSTEDNTLMAAYQFYTVANQVSLAELLNDALTMAKVRGHDVYNALDIMQNESILKELKFGIGDGTLQYYLYNWRLNRRLEPGEVGLIML